MKGLLTIKHFYLLLLLLSTLFVPTYAGEADSIAVLSSIKGADMTLYRIWCEKQSSDKETAADAAEVFLNGLDTSAKSIYIAHMHDYLADYYENDLFRFSDAISHCEVSLRHLLATGTPEQIARCETRLGKLYYQKGQYHIAFNHISTAAHTFEDLKSDRGLMSCKMILGAIYHQYGDMDEARKCFESIGKTAKMLNDSLTLSKSLHNLAILALSDRDTARTMRLLRLAINFGKSITDTSELCMMYLNTANIHIVMGQYDEAEEFMALARPLAHNDYLKGCWKQAYGRIYYGRRDFNKAISCLDEASNLLEKGEFEDRISSIHRTLHNIYIQLGDTAKAYSSLTKISDIWNSYTERDIMLELFHIRQDLTKSTAELRLKEEHDKRKLIVFIFAICLLVITFVSIIIYKAKSFRLKKKETEMRNNQKIAEVKKLYYIKMGSIINNAICELDKIRNGLKSEKTKSDLYRISSELKESVSTEKTEAFDTFVYDYDSDFHKKLQKRFPTLTTGERKLAIMLSKNLSTKEISDITRQSPESLYLARYRLRKKLGLTGSQESLEDFLKNI